VNGAVTIFCVAVPFLITAVAHAQCEWAQTVKSLDATVYETAVQAQFTFTDVGNNPVTVLQVKPSCGCTIYKLSKTILYPKETGQLDLVIQLGNQVGQFDKTVAVITDDGSGSDLTTILTIKINLPSPLTISPAFVSWQRGKPATPQVVRITWRGKTPIHITSITSSHRVIHTSLAPAKDGDGYNLTIWPTDTQETFYGTLLLHTDLKSAGPEKRFAIEVSVE
jgi:Protein of unknown function (DUF1573)